MYSHHFIESSIRNLQIWTEIQKSFFCENTFLNKSRVTMAILHLETVHNLLVAYPWLNVKAECYTHMKLP